MHRPSPERAVRPAEFGWGVAGLFFEDFAQVRAAAEGAGFGDVGDRKVAFDQQLPRAADAAFGDLVVDGAAEQLLEGQLERSPGDSDFAEDVVDAQLLRG